MNQKYKHFDNHNRKYARSGEDIRLIMKRQLPNKYLDEQAPMEQFWFRPQDKEAIEKEQKANM